MKRFVGLIKPNIELALTYRFEIGLWFVVNSIPLLVLVLVWLSSYASGHSIPGWDINRLVTYYMIGFFLDTFTECYFENWQVPNIRAGRIDHLMTKPVGYLSWIMTGHLAHKFINIAIRLPVMALIAYAILTFFQISLQTVSLSVTQILPFIFILIASFLFQAGLSLIIVLIGFWLESAEGLQHFKWIVISIFSGVMIPIDFLPGLLRPIAAYLPFKYLHAVPIGMLQSSYQITPGDIIYLTLTLMIVYGLINLMWYKAKLKYSASGG